MFPTPYSCASPHIQSFEIQPCPASKCAPGVERPTLLIRIYCENQPLEGARLVDGHPEKANP
jgi:hypothetical protein